MLSTFARAALPFFLLIGSAGAASHRRQSLAHKKYHSGHQSRLHASFAEADHENKKLLAATEVAELEVIDASRRLEAALLDAMSNATSSNATLSALRGASKATSNSSAANLKANVTKNLKTQQIKLDALFKHLKDNIANFNKREAEQKQDSTEYVKRLQERLDKDHKRLQDASLSDFDHEMLVNRTRMEERELKFWTRGRELQHDMFHSNLKLTHGLMSRVKTVMEAYQQMLSRGKVDSKLAKALHETLPPKAFIQREKRVRRDVRRLGKHLKLTALLLKHH
jgi:hypothetical protein